MSEKRVSRGAFDDLAEIHDRYPIAVQLPRFGHLAGTAPAEVSFKELERLWPIGAEDLVPLEPETPQIIATGSDHYVQMHNPDLVIAAIRLAIQRSSRKQ